MRKVSSFSIGALAVLLLTFILLGCGGGRSAPTGSNLKSMPAGRTIDLNQALAELDALQPPAGVDPVIFQELKDSLRGALIARGKIVCDAPSNPVNDLAEITPATDPPTIAWSANFFRGDGDASGQIGIADITPLAMNWSFGADAPEDKLFADYDNDKKVGITDVTPIAMGWGKSIGSFNVEWSETEGGTYALAGNVLFEDALPDKNANGFLVWNYQFDAGLFPVGATSVWVRVTPLDIGDPANVGVTSDPVEIQLTPVVTRDFYITGIRVNVTNTTNTDASDTVNEGTENYVAPSGGGDTFGEVMSNAVIHADLLDVYYLWKGNPISPDDPLPADLTQEMLDGYIADAKAYMSYSFTSTNDPIEGWTPSATQPPTGYEGRIGPNDDPGTMNLDGGTLVATMADNDATQGNASFEVSILLDQLEDPNAPLIVTASPTEQPQNQNALHGVRFNFGADEVGDELPSVVAIYNNSTKALVQTFDPASPVETSDPPTEVGTYTLRRIVGPGGVTTILTVLIAGSQLAQGVEYIWRITEDDGTTSGLRSSLYKPGTGFSILGPVYLELSTWPEVDFHFNDARQPFLYFLPDDPLVRRNPYGDLDNPLAEYPQWKWDDPIAAEDMVKASGGEFSITFGRRPPMEPPDPDHPRIYWNAGDTAPATIGDADGEMVIAARQPNFLAGLAGQIPDSESNYSFSIFSQEGDVLGMITRFHQSTPIIRTGVFINGECNFGVRPWGAAGNYPSPDWGLKAASIGNKDVVVFTFYNLWLRHDDKDFPPPEAERGTRLYLTNAISSADLNDMMLTPVMTDDVFNGGLCYMMLDVSREDLWFLPIVEPIPFGEYNVNLYNPGTGTIVTYPDNLFITP